MPGLAGWMRPGSPGDGCSDRPSNPFTAANGNPDPGSTGSHLASQPDLSGCDGDRCANQGCRDACRYGYPTGNGSRSLSARG
jgi:hypothetical protein